MKANSQYLWLAVAGLMLLPFAISPRAAFAVSAVEGQASDGQIQAEVQKKLDGSKYKGISIQVQGGIVKLTGTVELLSYKDMAEDRLRKIKGITGFDNQIQIASSGVSDAQLLKQISKKIYYDRIGWWDCPFNYITTSVTDGVVTLGGHAAAPIAAGNAVSIAANTPGVTDVIDEIQIDQVSQFDNQSRMALYAAIYGQSVLNMYASDPARPIRITVNNGQVTLNGVVDDNMAKDIAGIQAKSVPGVFGVKNDLVVQGSGGKK
jgi:hyperosmotically inducible periplasmic protein